MHKKPFIILAVLAVVSVFMIAILVSATEGIKKYSKGFVRKYSGQSLDISHAVLADINVKRLVGYTSDALYFTGDIPNIITRTTYDLKITDSFLIPLRFMPNMLSAYTMTVDSPNVTVYANNLHRIFKLRFGKSHYDSTNISTGIFTRATPISDASIAARAIDTTNGQLYFCRINKTTGTVMARNQIMENNTDFGFSSDGMLEYDVKTNLLVYVQYFQNRIYCFDTAMQLRYLAHTIDTNTTKTISTADIVIGDKGGKFQSSSPMRPVNKYCTITKGRLLVASAIQAENDNSADFAKNTSVDVYEIATGQYEGSFQIPNDRHGKRHQSIEIIDGHLIVFYHKAVACYKFDASVY